MARPIDADELKKEVESAFHGALGITVTGAVHEIIDRQPTIDLESLRPTAHWECLSEAEALEYGSKYAASYCSLCRGRVRCRGNYCPHCGAKMEDESDGETD